MRSKWSHLLPSRILKLWGRIVGSTGLKGLENYFLSILQPILQLTSDSTLIWVKSVQLLHFRSKIRWKTHFLVPSNWESRALPRKNPPAKSGWRALAWLSCDSCSKAPWNRHKSSGFHGKYPARVGLCWRIGSKFGWVGGTPHFGKPSIAWKSCVSISQNLGRSFPLVMTHTTTTVERSTILNGKTHYFHGHFPWQTVSH